MFKSIRYIKYLKNNDYLVEIIDDNFKEQYVGRVKPDRHKTSSIEASAIINCYSSKNLNVAKNLFLFMQYCYKYYNYSISEQISFFKQEVPDFEIYFPEIQKYINLL